MNFSGISKICRQLLDLMTGFKLYLYYGDAIQTSQKGLSAGRVQSLLFTENASRSTNQLLKTMNRIFI